MSEPSSNPDSPPGNPTPEIPSPSDAAQGRYQRNERSRDEPSPAPSETKPDLPAPASPVETKADPYEPPRQDPTPQAPPPPPPAAGGNPTDKKLVAGLLGILLGGFGIHKFYLGYTQEGVIMLAVTLGVGIIGGALTCGLLTPLVIPMSVIGLIEGILYLTKSDEEFVATYVTGRKPWF